MLFLLEESCFNNSQLLYLANEEALLAILKNENLMQLLEGPCAQLLKTGANLYRRSTSISRKNLFFHRSKSDEFEKVKMNSSQISPKIEMRTIHRVSGDPCKADKSENQIN